MEYKIIVNENSAPAFDFSVVPIGVGGVWGMVLHCDSAAGMLRLGHVIPLLLAQPSILFTEDGGLFDDRIAFMGLAGTYQISSCQPDFMINHELSYSTRDEKYTRIIRQIRWTADYIQLKYWLVLTEHLRLPQLIRNYLIDEFLEAN